MSFLPEEDQEFLAESGIPHQELSEKTPDGSERRGVLFSDFTFNGNMWTPNGAGLVACGACDLLVVIPGGYSTTKLDSFYTSPRLKRADGVDPQNANTEAALFQRTWQFWSRHL